MKEGRQLSLVAPDGLLRDCLANKHVRRANVEEQIGNHQRAHLAYPEPCAKKGLNEGGAPNGIALDMRPLATKFPVPLTIPIRTVPNGWVYDTRRELSACLSAKSPRSLYPPATWFKAPKSIPTDLG